MKKYILLGLVIFFSGCSNYSIEPNSSDSNYVKRSLYLNQPLSRFELDNGFCYAREPLPNGGYINYWKSDSGNIIADALDWDSYPYCKLALITDNKNIIRKIKILEDDVKCVSVLK